MKILSTVNPEIVALTTEYADKNRRLKNAFVSQDQCRVISKDFADFARLKGFRAITWTLTGPLGTFTETPRRWRDIPQENWIHHVTEVEGLWIDFTAKQFGSNQPFPKIYRSRRELKGQWTQIRRD